MTKLHRNSLQPGHLLLSYRIETVLGQGGFGITYLARDLNLEREVAIKEYLPIEFAVREGDHSVHPVSAERGEQYRWGLERFLSEARTLAKFQHPNIVRVLHVFEANHTAYMVMEYEHGESLQERLTQRQTLEEGELLRLLVPLLGGLEQVHARGFIHRDIKPANIFLRADGSPVLIDFGSARQALREQNRTLTSIVSPGYAPFEQYYSSGESQGPWTDIYALGATLYRAVLGRAPLDAVDRSKGLLEAQRDSFVTCTEIGRGRYSERFLAAVDAALQFRSKDRPQSIAAWRRTFDLPEAPSATPAVPASEQPTIVPAIARHTPAAGTPDAPKASAPTAGTRGIKLALIAVSACLVALLGVVAFWMLRPEPTRQPDTAVATTTVTAPTPSTGSVTSTLPAQTTMPLSCDWTGEWQTFWMGGHTRMHLTQGNRGPDTVDGNYQYKGGQFIGARIKGDTLTGEWRENDGAGGPFTFQIRDNCTRFSGRYSRADNPLSSTEWNGERVSNSGDTDINRCDWTGTWKTEWGTMQLADAGRHTGTAARAVTGTYDYNNGRLEGASSDGVLSGTWWQDGGRTGAFVFVLNANNCNGYTGKWRYQDEDDSAWRTDWNGARE